MVKELYFDVVSEEGAGGLYITKDSRNTSFYYHYTATNLETDKTTVSETRHPSFDVFWKEFTRNNRWFILHPLYIHPEQRPFIKKELQKVNWNVIAAEKWREMYEQQWNKVLNNPAEYYKPM